MAETILDRYKDFGGGSEPRPVVDEQTKAAAMRDIKKGSTLQRAFTPAELNAIIRKMTSGQKLTPQEAAAIGISEPSSITKAGTAVAGTAVVGTNKPVVEPTDEPDDEPDDEPVIPVDTMDAFAVLESGFKEAGIDDPEFFRELKKFMVLGYGPERATLELRKTKAYQTRFAGNQARLDAGLNVLSEAAYLELENSYMETLRAYGQQGFFGPDKKLAKSKMAQLIGNDISATEFKDRIDTVVTRVNNSDPAIKNTLKSFYGIGDEDLVGYFLNPKENLPRLQEKVAAAEIGSAALAQKGLTTSVASAEALAKLGITKEQARAGYQDIAEVLPTGSKLGQIYDEEGIDYTQKTAEEEVFGQLESAKRKRLRLAEKEIASFSGSSGANSTSLSGQTKGII